MLATVLDFLPGHREPEENSAEPDEICPKNIYSRVVLQQKPCQPSELFLSSSHASESSKQSIFVFGDLACTETSFCMTSQACSKVNQLRICHYCCVCSASLSCSSFYDARVYSDFNRTFYLANKLVFEALSHKPCEGLGPDGP